MPWKIDISSDATLVTFNPKALTADDEIDVDEIMLALSEQNIEITPDVEARVEKVIACLGDPTQAKNKLVLAQATPAQPGTDGFFQWIDALDPEKRLVPIEAEDKAETGRSSFYEHSGLIVAKESDTLGVHHSPTEGKPGRNVLGRSIEPQPVNDVNLTPGKNVKLLPDGKTFVAECDGMPVIQNDVLNIDPVLTIDGAVDFSTGNVQYGGDVNIAGDVKDLFAVTAEGDINIGGTVEAASIECGGSLAVKRGVTGKEKGVLKVKGNLSAKYLSNVDVWVGGDIEIGSEIVNTNLNCRGKITLAKGAIHGGQVTAAGSIESPSIGSTAGVRTIVRVGIDPFLEEQIKQIEEVVSQANERIAILMPEAKTILDLCRGKPNDRVKKLAQEIRSCKEQIEELQPQLDQLTEQMAQACNGTIIVHKIIYPGTVLYIGPIVELIRKEITGPIEVVVEPTEDDGDRLAMHSLSATR